MRAKSQIQNPDDVEITLTLTTTLGQWKRLDKQLPLDWPSMHLKQAISGLVYNAERAGLIDLAPEDQAHA